MFSLPSLLHLTIVFVNTELLETNKTEFAADSLFIHNSQAIQIHFLCIYVL